MRYKKLWNELKHYIEVEEQISLNESVANPFSTYGELMYWTGAKEEMQTILHMMVKLEKGAGQ